MVSWTTAVTVCTDSSLNILLCQILQHKGPQMSVVAVVAGVVRLDAVQLCRAALVSIVVKALCYKPEGREFDTQ
jgi:hypothetical protein